MTVISSLYSGISGIVSNGSALSVAGDNIANMSTPGFKSSNAVFESALVQRIGQAEVGLGSRLAGTSANFTQGAFAGSTRGTDMAIQGKGFFWVKDTGGNSFYTRAGNFERNGDGELVMSGSGYILQGYRVTNGSVESSESSISFQNTQSDPVATALMEFSLNLDADADIQGTFDGSSGTAADGSSSYSVSQTIYDSLGNPHSATTYFNRTAANTWGYHTLVDGSELSNYTGPSGGTVIIAQGTLSFTSGGALSVNSVDASGTESSGVITAAGGQVTPGSGAGIQWAGGATTQDSITLDFGDVTGSDQVTTQYADSASTTQTISQDGRKIGKLQSFEVGTDGVIVGKFSNGTSRDLYQIKLATFANEEGLNRIGANVYAQSSDSGAASYSDAGAGDAGEVRAFQLEQSNVDLASEFVKIITYQRAFQASARTVSTAADLLQDLVNLGR